jgi:hypothetical protein
MRKNSLFMFPLAVLLIGCLAGLASEIKVGQPAPTLNGTLWVGQPVSLDAVKGNVVVLAFWNIDSSC